MEKLYSVRINRKNGNSKFVLFCDDHWYEVRTNNVPNYTMERAIEVTEQLKNHYCYNLDIVDKDGNVVKHVAWIKEKHKPHDVNHATTIVTDKGQKKCVFSLNTKSLLKVSKKFGGLK